MRDGWRSANCHSGRTSLHESPVTWHHISVESHTGLRLRAQYFTTLRPNPSLRQLNTTVRRNLCVHEIIAFVAHTRIPYFCVGLPGFTGKLVGVIVHRPGFTTKRNAKWIVI